MLGDTCTGKTSLVVRTIWIERCLLLSVRFFASRRSLLTTCRSIYNNNNNSFDSLKGTTGIRHEILLSEHSSSRNA